MQMDKKFTEDQISLIRDIFSETLEKVMEYGRNSNSEVESDSKKIPKNGIKRDKFIAVRFDKKMHKEISRIKLDYEIDIQDFIYVAVERFKEEFFPNGKASKEGLDIIKQAIDKINGKTLDE